MRISLSVICLGVAAGCVTPQHMPTTAAARSPCEIAPSLTVCKDASIELTAQSAKQRLDAEYARLEAAEDGRFAREFAVESLLSAAIKMDSFGYAYLRDRALYVIGNASIDTGERYFMLAFVLRALFWAGDIDYATKTIRDRRKLIRNRPKNQDWHWLITHGIILNATKEKAWFDTAAAAAAVGNVILAIDILTEANPESERDTHEYLVKLAAIHVAARQFSKGEEVAVRALKKKPFDPRRKREVFNDTVIDAYKLLIQSLMAQNKPIDESVKELYGELTGIYEYLSGHAFNFFMLARDLAEFAPTAARRFLETGRQINSISADQTKNPRRDTEFEACEALQDDECMLEIAAQEEAKLEDDLFTSLVAVSYVTAGDLDSAKRILSRLGVHGCDALTYAIGTDRLLRDNDTGRAQAWLEDWVRCQANTEPNWQTRYGLGGNHWASIARDYAALSRKQQEAGQRRNALINAKSALLLAMEAENTWKLEYLGYRAEDLGSAYGSAFGALVMAEQSLRP